MILNESNENKGFENSMTNIIKTLSFWKMF